MMKRRSFALLFLLSTAGFLFLPVSRGENKENPGETRLLPAEYDVWSFDRSPDGKQIVFSGKMKGEDSTQMRVWLWTPPDGTPSEWTNTKGLMDASPRWSPQGDGVVMVRRSLANLETGHCLTSSLWWKAYPSGEGLQLTSGPEDREPAWSPDGKSIVFLRGDGPFTANLMIVDRNGKNPRALTTGDNALATPFWGVDGWIYYTRYHLVKRQVTMGSDQFTTTEIQKGVIERINPASGRMERVVEDEFDNRAPALSPDGSMLAFVSSRDIPSDKRHMYDRAGLWVMDLKQRDKRELSDKAGLNGATPVWSKSGDSLTFFSFRHIRPALWTIALHAVPEATATPETGGVRN
jgi:Tol biopolymer transport system component